MSMYNIQLTWVHAISFVLMNWNFCPKIILMPIKVTQHWYGSLNEDKDEEEEKEEFSTTIINARASKLICFGHIRTRNYWHIMSVEDEETMYYLNFIASK